MKTPTGLGVSTSSRSSLLHRLLLWPSLAMTLLPSTRLAAQSAPYPVALGHGSYAGSVPDAVAQTDAYYGLPANQISGPNGIYDSLHLDAAKRGSPLPTTHWWTDLLIADRSNLPDKSTQYVLKQAAFGGKQWV